MLILNKNNKWGAATVVLPLLLVLPLVLQSQGQAWVRILDVFD